MQARKWNFTTRQYEPYTTPDDWHCPLICQDMDQIINCASCGAKLPYGQTYTSRRIHTSAGLGYGVCGACYDQDTEQAIHKRPVDTPPRQPLP